MLRSSPKPGRGQPSLPFSDFWSPREGREGIVCGERVAAVAKAK